MHFRAFLDNQPLDFSDFWYVTSLIYFFKYDTGSFARKIFVGQKRQKHHINLLVILVITNWHWILNYVCSGSQQNNFFSCSIGIFHVLEFSHFPFPLNFLAYIHSLSLTHSLSCSSHLVQQERNLMEFMECAILLLSDRFLNVYLKISTDLFVLFLCFITIKFRCNYRD